MQYRYRYRSRSRYRCTYRYPLLLLLCLLLLLLAFVCSWVIKAQNEPTAHWNSAFTDMISHVLKYNSNYNIAQTNETISTYSKTTDAALFTTKTSPAEPTLGHLFNSSNDKKQYINSQEELGIDGTNTVVTRLNNRIRAPSSSRKLQYLSRAYDGIRVPLPNSNWREQVTIPGDGVSLTVTIHARNIICFDIQLESFTVQLDATVNLIARQQAQQLHLQDKTFVLDNVRAAVTLADDLEDGLLGSLQFGSLLDVQEIFPCLLINAYDVRNPEIEVMIRDIIDFDELLQTTNLASVSSWGSIKPRITALQFISSKEGLPYVAGSTIRNLLHDSLKSYIIQASCPETVDGNVFLDFRDFLLSPNQAASLDGTGLNPYGDIGQTLYGFLQDFLQPTDDSGQYIALNSVIRSSTEKQSGEQGTIRHKGEIISYDVENFLKNLTFPLAFLNAGDSSYLHTGILDLRLLNLDTLSTPAVLFEPTDQAHVTKNILSFAGQWKDPTTSIPTETTVADSTANSRTAKGALGLAIKGFFNLDFGSSSPYTMNNEVDFMYSAESMELLFDVAALISTQQLFRLPLKDLVNLNCWLAMTTVSLNNTKLQQETNMTRESNPNKNNVTRHGLSFQTFDIELGRIIPTLTCVNCSHNGFNNALVPIKEILSDRSVVKMLQDTLEFLFEELILDDVPQAMLDEFLIQTRQFCPQWPEYNKSAAYYVPLPHSFPQISIVSIDSIIFVVALASQMTLIFVAEVIHATKVSVGNMTNYTDLLSGQQYLKESNITADRRIADFTNIKYPLVELFLEEFRGFTSSEGSNPEDVAVNVFLKEILGLDDGVFTFSFASTWVGDINATVAISDLIITFDNVEIEGLDSFTRIDLLNVTAPQTFSNSVGLEYLRINVSLGLDHRLTPSPRQDIEVSFGIRDLYGTIPLLLAIDETKFEDLILGKFLFLDEIFSCLLTIAPVIQFPQFLVEVGDLLEVSVSGLRPETSEAMNKSLAIMMESIPSKLREVVPFVSETVAKQTLNDVIKWRIDNAVCVDPYIGDRRYVDFKLMFQPSQQPTPDLSAEELDKDRRVNSPYGEIFYLAKALVDRLYLAEDASSNSSGPILNSGVLRPITYLQSGVYGTIFVEQDLGGISYSDVIQDGDYVSLSFSDLRFENVDSFGLPMKIIEPNATDPYLIDNRFSLGVGKPIILSFISNFAIDGPRSVSMNNTVKFEIAASDLEFFAVLFLKVRHKELLEMKLEHMIDEDCWAQLFTTFSGPSAETGFRLDHASFNFSNVDFGLTCVNCTTKSLAELPTLLGKLDSVFDVVFHRIGDLVVSVLNLFINTGILDVIVLEAAYNCSRNDVPLPENTKESSYVPPLSLDSLETLAFTTYVLIQIVLDLTIDEHATFDLHENSTLDYIDYIDNLTQSIPPDVQLINFTDVFPGNILGWFNNFASASIYHAVEGSDNLIINVLQKLAYADETSKLIIDKFIEAGLWRIGVKDVTAIGLDTLTAFHIFHVSSPQTLDFEFAYELLEIQFRFMAGSVFVSGSSNETDNNEQTLEYVASLGLENLNVSASLFLALDEDELLKMKLGQFLDVDRFFPCLFNVSHVFEVTKLFVTATNFRALKVDGFESPDILEVIEELNKVLTEQYDENLDNAIPAIFDLTVRELVNVILRSFDNECIRTYNESSAGSITGGGFIDYRDLLLSESMSRFYGGSGLSPYGRWFYYLHMSLDLIFDLFSDTDNSDVNEILFVNDPLLPMLPSGSEPLSFGHYSLQRELFSFLRDIKLYNIDIQIKFVVSSVEIENFYTFGVPISLFQPTIDSPYDLNNTLTLGVGGKPVLVTIGMLYEIKVGRQVIRNDLNVTFVLHSVSLAFDGFFKIPEKRLFDFPFEDLLNMNCWVALLPASPLDTSGFRLEGEKPSAGFTRLAINAEKTELKLACDTGSCTNKRFFEFQHFLQNPNSTDAYTDDFNSNVGSVLSLLGGQFLEDVIDRTLDTAARRCPHRNEFVPGYEGEDGYSFESMKFKPPQNGANEETLKLALAGFPFLVVFVTFAIFVWYAVKKRNEEWLEGLSKEEFYLVRQRQRITEDLKLELDTTITRSMFCSRNEIPTIVRHTVPWLVLVSIALLAVGHNSTVGTGSIFVQVAGERVEVNDLISFSILEAFIAMMTSGNKVIAVNAFLFAVVWPYARQIITLLLWFVPPKQVSTSIRGKVLSWFDFFAKWSTVDTLLLVLSAVSLSIEIVGLEVDFFEEGLFSIGSYVRLRRGLYATVSAQLISQFTLHLAVHYHNKIVERGTRVYEHKRNLRQPASASTETAGNCSLKGDFCKSNSRDGLLCIETDEQGVDNVRINEDDVDNQKESGDRNGPSRELNLNELYGERRDRLCTHAYIRQHRDPSEKLVTRLSMNVLLIVSVMFTGYLIGWAFRAPFLSFETLGLAGAIHKWGGGTSVEIYSIQRIVDSLRKAENANRETSGFVGLSLLSALLVVTILVMPFAQMVVLFYQWFVPMTGKRRLRILEITEILQSWSYGEVFLFAIFIEAWHLQAYASEVTIGICGEIDEKFAALTRYGILSDGNGMCYGRDMNIESGCYMMIVSVCLLHLFYVYVTMASKQYFAERDEWYLAIGEQELQHQSSIPDSDNFKPFPVLFTDMFRWTLCNEFDIWANMEGEEGHDDIHRIVREEDLWLDGGFAWQNEEEPVATLQTTNQKQTEKHTQTIVVF